MITITKRTLLLGLCVSMTAFADDAQPASNDSIAVQTFEQQVEQRQQQLREQHEQQQQIKQVEQAKQAAPDPTANMQPWQKALTPTPPPAADNNKNNATPAAPTTSNTNNNADTANKNNTVTPPAATNTTPSTATSTDGTAAVEPTAPAPKVSPATGYIPMMQGEGAKKGNGKIQYY